MTKYVLGLDYGTDSLRVLLVNVTNGEEIASVVSYYPRWKKGLYCDPQRDQFRQHPLDYLECLQECFSLLWEKVSSDIAESVIGISVDTTGSTPIALDVSGKALALRDDFQNNPNAMFVLWKDHTSIAEADEITAAAKRLGLDYTSYCGGVYSSEWYWAKMLHVFRADAEVVKSAYLWVEHCDWLPAVLTDTTHPKKIRFGRCASGHKMLWHESWGGFPPDSFFANIDPILKGMCDRLPIDTYTSDKMVGGLSEDWAKHLGLPAGIPIGFGAFDCHMGAVAANVERGVLTKVMGTSTCDITVAPKDAIKDKCIHGICGQVNGSVIPDMIGLEAGQSAFGDVYAWYQDLVTWPLQNLLSTFDGIDDKTKVKLTEELNRRTLDGLSECAATLSDEGSQIIALDWLNGRRTPDANQRVSLSIVGLKMGVDAPRLFKALVQATAFGGKAIIDRFLEEGIPVESVVAIGGISKKSDFVMQTCADVWGLKINVLDSEQSCALGAAIFAAVVGGAYKTVEEAQKNMASKVCKTYYPDRAKEKHYQALFCQYQVLGDFVEKVSL